MATMHRLVAVVIAGLAASASLIACTGDDGSTTEVNCATEDRDDDFLAGMQKVGASGLTFTLVSATPSPPARDDNTWVLDVATPAGPLDGAVTVTPFMPDHRHGTSVPVVVTPDAATPGRYELTPPSVPPVSSWPLRLRARNTGSSPA